ncbi:hypothetical protein GALMADRAFT_138397 [Galerina marginata CBS 339.88]|uniref:Uncharacterized protein n=1 Tax=Galerina marginata (strain CBS 339.88) TaxID=685588 RepID=A0A067T7E3_GALM3|nr:hypothetical protein GALMADRAFT_138397 [Galerina marginata CBS 339.88]
MNDLPSESVDAKYPGQNPGGLPPSPTIENPGRVFPKSDPSKGKAFQCWLSVNANNNSSLIVAVITPRRTTPEQYVGNPFMMNTALDKLDHAFGEVIATFEQEDRSQDRGDEGNPLLHKFKSWRVELERIRRGEEELPPPDGLAQPQPRHQGEGGTFAD